MCLVTRAKQQNGCHEEVLNCIICYSLSAKYMVGILSASPSYLQRERLRSLPVFKGFFTDRNIPWFVYFIFCFPSFENRSWDIQTKLAVSDIKKNPTSFKSGFCKSSKCDNRNEGLYATKRTAWRSLQSFSRRAIQDAIYSCLREIVKEASTTNRSFKVHYVMPTYLSAI